MTVATANGAFPRDARSAAELYLLRGLAPVPMPTRSKDPGFAGWNRLRVTPDDLAAHFPTGEPRNVGVLNGGPSGHVLDVDLDCGEAIAAADHLLPATGWVFGRKTAPRSHRLYRVTGGALNTASEKYADLAGAALVELRGTGGLTVYPPSLHKDTGELICWNVFHEPGEVKLGDLRRAVGEVAAAALLARHWPAKGRRQDAYLALADGLLRPHLDQDRAERLVEALAKATRDEEAGKRLQTVALTLAKIQHDEPATGWPKLVELLGEGGQEVMRLVRRWLGLLEPTSPASPAGKVRALEPYRPFPVEALPAPLAEYVRQGAAALGCDPAYLALPALAVVASVVGNARAIRLKRGWEEPCVLWSAIVGDSGTLKSPAYLKAVSYLFRLQRQQQLEFKERRAKYQEELQEYKEAKRTAREEGTAPGDPPEEPLLRRVVVSDTTVEKLAEILEDNPRGTLVARDELAGWLGSFTKYKGKGAASDLPNWLEMHRAGTVIVDRKTSERKTLFIPRAAVSVTGGIQPGVLARALTPEFLDAGLAARLLMAMPPRLPKRWTEAEVAPEVERAYHDALDRLLALDLDSRDGEKVPHVVTLAEDGKAAWVGFYDSWAREQAAAEGELAAAFSKLEGYAARFALLHHVVEQVARGEDDLAPVGRESVEAGVALCRWFACEARRIYSTLSESTEERDTRRLEEFIRQRDGAITVRELMRANCRRYPDAETAETALARLVEAGRARWVEPQTAMKGGKPIKAVELCMTHDTDDTDLGGGDDGDPGADDGEDDTAPEGDPGSRPMRPDATGCDEGTPGGGAGVIGVMRHAKVAGHVPREGEADGRCHSANGEASHAVTRSPFVGKARSGSGPPYVLVNDLAGLEALALALGGAARVGLDLETTGLDPRRDRVRLLSLAVETAEGGASTYLVDRCACDPSPLWGPLAGKELVIHNAAFDLAFLSRLGFTPAAKVYDTMLLAQLLTAGTAERATLAACCRRWLSRDLDKREQKSDWSGELSAEQLGYAALDAEVLLPLLNVLAAKVKEAGLVETAGIETRCLPAVAWMASRGVPLDRDAWTELARSAGDQADSLREELDRTAPPKAGELFDSWNWDSTQQARQALALAGCEVANTADETLAGVEHPLADLLRRYRLAGKRASTYGADWLKHVADDGRVYPSWRQVGAASGRMSCGSPNMQQLPRGEHRRCVAAPPGRLLVKADYSQVEPRIAAKVSGDQALLEAYQRGDDLHTITARNVLGAETVTKQDRQLAKALNFGLLYGMGARGFRRYAKGQYGLDLSEAEATRYRTAFFNTYPGLAAWHRRVRSRKEDQTRTLAGRRRLLDDKTPDTHRLNTPIQGAGADGLKLALALLWERREQAPAAFPVLAVHDEIVVEADADQAEAVVAWLKAAMVEAMAPLLDPVPVEVEVKVALTWAGD